MKSFNTKILLLIFLFCLTIVTSCSGDEDSSATTYALKNEMTNIDGVTIDIACFEYNSIGESIGMNTVTNIRHGNNRTYIANDNAVKVKVYEIIRGKYKTSYVWIQQVYYLKKNRNINITISDDTIVGPIEP